MLALARIVINTPWLLIAMLVVASGVFGFYKGWSIEHDNKIAAVASLDADWRLKLETANREAENEANRRVQEAAEAAALVVPAGPTPADLDRLCEADATCRDKRG